MRTGLLSLALLLGGTPQASAEWQVKPFVGPTFGGSTTFVHPADAAGRPHAALGITGVLLGDVLGVEADVGYVRGFFGDRDVIVGKSAPVVASSAVTLTGNVVVALPRRMAQYTLRPYFVGGAGLIRARIDPGVGGEGLQVASTLPGVDLGGGVTGFLSRRVGLGWDVRHFRSVGTGEERGQSFGPEQLSFWRASMAVAIRY